MSNKYTFILLCCLSLATGGFAMPSTQEHLGVEDGLSNNYVKDIAQDGKGCIWVATESGLNRFDGHAFTVFDENNSALVSNELNTLLYDVEENKLWIGSQRNGISIFDCFTHQFQNLTINEGLATNDITCLSHASDGGIWITHYHQGIEHYDKKTGTLTLLDNKTVEGLPAPNWVACDDGQENLYVGHVYWGLSVVNLKTKTVKTFSNNPGNPKSLPGNTVYSICIDKYKNVWVGTNGGLALFNPQTEAFTCFRHEAGNPHSLIADPVYSIREMSDGTLWIASDMGGISILDLHRIMLVNPAEVRFRNIPACGDESTLSSANIRSLLQDSFGNIWIGNYGSGLDFIARSQPLFKALPYTTGNKAKSKPVWGVHADGEKQIWLGGTNEIAVFRDNRLQRTIQLSDYLSGRPTNVLAIKRDKQGCLWLGLYDENVLRIHPENNRVERIALENIYNSPFISFFEDEDDKMWIASVGGLFSYKNGVVQKEDSINRQLLDMTVYSVLRDRQGKLWVGTFGKGISIFDKDNRLFTHIEKANGFCSNAIHQLLIDSNGSIWAATRDGLGYFSDSEQPEKFESYGYKQGLENKHVFSIHEDEAGNIWLSTGKGISQWNKQKRKFANYEHRDGIPLGNFFTNSVCSTSDGMIYFGSSGGVCYFNPKDFTEAKQVAKVQILECKVLFSQKIENHTEAFPVPSEKGIIDMPYSQNTVRFSFSVPDYSQNGQVEYACRMENLDNEWHNTQGENQVTFRNVPPGKYTFKVRARLRNQDWDEQHTATMNVLISPPLWKTWYAKTLYIIISMLLVYGVIRFYKARLELESSLETEKRNSLNEHALNQERLRFYTNITHELRTPLTLILGPLEDLLNDRNLPDYYHSGIKLIHDNATRLLNLINQLLEFRKTETQNRRLTVARGDLGRLVTETGLRYKELNRNKKVRFRISIETDRTTLYFDSEIIITVLNNLLSNALKYTPEGEISLTLSSVDEKGRNYAEIRVSDTGYGISPDDLPRIFDRYYQAKSRHQASGTGIGLALVKSLADLHGAILSVESREGEGSTFRFRILTDNTYADSLHDEEKPATVMEPYPEENITEENTDSLPVILVVEDNDDIRNYIVQSLSAQYKTLSAANGKEGLELAQNRIPNIIVSDVMMPEMDGIELCRKIKEDLRTSHIPVVLLTAKDSISDKEEGYESGADSYLTKPFSAKLLHSRVNNLLESRRKLMQQIMAQIKANTVQKQVPTSAQTAEMSMLDKEFLSQIIAVIEANLNNEQLNITFVTKKMNMSQSTFYRKMKGLTGMSANEFIRKIRLKNAANLLLSGAYNVSETAYMSGFNHIDYFRECFKEEYGMSPSEYLKQKENDGLPDAIISPDDATS
jgi:signal transduction histidine kinase/ligand-binding sensor domain-containing protein/DNA-binding response OmpR family regulator